MSSAAPQSPSSAIFVNPNDTRHCSQCKRVELPAGQAFKRCLSCREKGRNYKKRAAATRAALANLDVPNTDSAQPIVKGKRKERAEEDASGRKGRMTKRMRNVLEDKPSATSTIVSISHESRDSTHTKYNTATDMYIALKSSRSSPRIQFRGSFSIVAVDKIDHRRRERLVVEELKKIAKWSFAHDKPTIINKGVGASNKSVSVLYRCTCHKKQTRPAALTSTRPNSLLAALATGAAPPHKHKQSDLMTWMGKSSNDSATAIVKCKGKVRITVEEDNSHPVQGIEGQKITIRIKH